MCETDSFEKEMNSLDGEREKELQEETYLEDQPLSEEDKELLEKIYDRLDIFEEMNRHYHETAKDCRKIVHMEFYEEECVNTKNEDKGK